jgi:hypothetical protein
MVDAQEEGSSLLEEPKLGFQTCKLGNTTVDGSKCLLAMKQLHLGCGHCQIIFSISLQKIWDLDIS